MDEAVQQYCDYYESDDEDIDEFKYITTPEKARFAKVFKDYSRPMNDIKTVNLIPGFKTGASPADMLGDLRSRVFPEAKKLAGIAAAKYIGPFGKGKDFKYFSGEQTETQLNLSDIFSSHLSKLEERFVTPDRLSVTEKLEPGKVQTKINTAHKAPPAAAKPAAVKAAAAKKENESRSSSSSSDEAESK
jgi:hypothetical protein